MTSGSYPYFEYMDEISHVSNGLNSEIGFKSLEGMSICFSIEEMRIFLESEYPIEVAAIRRTVSAENEARKNFAYFMSQNPKSTISKAGFKAEFGRELGSRAAIRVWEAVANEYSHLKTPGRKQTQS